MTYSPINDALKPRSQRSSVFARAASMLDPTPDPEWDDPCLWARQRLAGWNPTPYQEEVLANLARRHRASVRGPHGLGKTGIAAVGVLWFADTRDRAGVDWKVVTTAGNWRQLTHYLWPEIHKWARKLRHRQLTRYELLTLEMKLRFGQATSVASDDPANIEGAHADEILYIIDEAKNVVPDTWDAVEGALSTGSAYVLAISTPGRAQGRFFDIQTRKPGYDDWWVRHVSLEEAISAGRISRDWADKRRIQWGETSSVYVNRVLGEFSTKDQEGIIPLDWVEAAQARWGELSEQSRLELQPFSNVSCDVSSTGPDATIIVVRHGSVVSRMINPSRGTTMATTGILANMLQPYPRRKAYAVVDVIGVGTGVVDRLRELGHAVDAFDGRESSRSTDRTGELTFLNRRAEAWWHLKDLLDPTYGSDVALPMDDFLTGDLTMPKWEQTSSGRIKVEEKDEIRKRLGRSPDFGDAVVMSFHGRSPRTLFTDAPPISFEQTSMWTGS